MHCMLCTDTYVCTYVSTEHTHIHTTNTYILTYIHMYICTYIRPVCLVSHSQPLFQYTLPYLEAGSVLERALAMRDYSDLRSSKIPNFGI